MWRNAENDETECHLSLKRVWCTWSEVGRRRTLCNKVWKQNLQKFSRSATSSKSRKPGQSSTRGVQLISHNAHNTAIHGFNFKQAFSLYIDFSYIDILIVRESLFILWMLKENTTHNLMLNIRSVSNACPDTSKTFLKASVVFLLVNRWLCADYSAHKSHFA